MVLSDGSTLGRSTSSSSPPASARATWLARECGLAIGERGGVVVGRHLCRTSDPADLGDRRGRVARRRALPGPRRPGQRDGRRSSPTSLLGGDAVYTSPRPDGTKLKGVTHDGVPVDAASFGDVFALRSPGALEVT
jgi:nitrite reductase (NADH) large subunit